MLLPRIVGLFAILLVPGNAHAQVCNPYVAPESCVVPAQPTADAACVVPYPGSALFCTIGGTHVEPTVFTFGEGVVHAPGSEYAWLVLTNTGTEAQTAHVELIVTGRKLPITRQITLGPKARQDLMLHALPELAGDGIPTFSTVVYFPDGCLQRLWAEESEWMGQQQGGDRRAPPGESARPPGLR